MNDIVELLKYVYVYVYFKWIILVMFKDIWLMFKYR